MSAFISELVERSLAEYLRTQSLDIASIYEGQFNEVGQENEESEPMLATPRVVCSCLTASQYAFPANNWQCEAVVEVHVNRNDKTASEFRQMAGQVASALCAVHLANDLTVDGSDFTCLHVNQGQQGWSQEGDNYSFTQSLELFCTPADVN